MNRALALYVSSQQHAMRLLLLLGAAAAGGVVAHAQSSDPDASGGAFGRWATDEYGLPVFRFALDQTIEQSTAKNYSRVVRDSAEVGETSQGPFHEDATSAMFMIGNDELILL